MTFLDGLRAIAALVVVFPHSVGMLVVEPPTRFVSYLVDVGRLGVYGVQVFFVLSGFVIAYSLRPERVTPAFFARFVLRRSIRLDPPYWVAILFALAEASLRRSVGHHPVIIPGPTAIVSHFFYLQDVLGYRSANGVFWTLCLEIQFYVVYCVLLGLFQAAADRFQRSHAVVAGLLVCCFVFSLAWPAGIARQMPAWFAQQFYGFLAGVLTFACVNGDLRSQWAGVGGILTLVVAVAARDIGCGVVLVSSASIYFCAHLDGLYRWLNQRPLQFVGRISYCLYLLHLPIAWMVLSAYTRFPTHNLTFSLVAIAVVYGVSIAAAYLLHVTVERPALRLARRVRTHWDVERPVLVAAV